MCVFKEIYYKELAHIIMEAEKSRPRRAYGIVLIKYESPRSRRDDHLSSSPNSSLKAGRKPVSKVEDSQAERKNTSLL